MMYDEPRKGKTMSIGYIRDTYKVPAKRGGRITYHDQGKDLRCTIVGAQGPYLRARADGHGPRCILTLHPTWNIRYDDMPEERGHVQ